MENPRRSTRETYSCDVCEKRFVSTLGLEEHRRTHVVEHTNEIHKKHPKLDSPKQKKKKSYSCDFCQKQFLSLHYFRLHVNIHTGGKANRCDVCQKEFLSLSKLKEHYLSHTEEKYHSCKICHKKFPLKKSLLLHMRKRPCLMYTCNACNNRFVSIAQLSNHKKLCKGKISSSVLKKEPKEDESLFCKICNKSFIDQQQLDTHLCLDKPKNFVCKTCKQCFPNQALLEKHCLIHSENQPFQCNLCPRTFIKRQDMIGHFRKVHANRTIYYTDNNVFVE